MLRLPCKTGRFSTDEIAFSAAAMLFLEYFDVLFITLDPVFWFCGCGSSTCTVLCLFLGGISN
jgi:hypothetical protein